jgi:hypothetical protein
MSDGAAVSASASASQGTGSQASGWTERVMMVALQVSLFGTAAYFTLRHLDFGASHPQVLHGLGMVVLLAMGTVPVMAWVNGANAQKRLLAGLATAVTLIASALFLSPSAQSCLFAFAYVIVLTMLPAGFYVVFRKARGYSLADEFVSNLTRLGVAHSGDRRRLIAYVREFDALYGPLDERQRALIHKSFLLSSDDLPGDERTLLERLANATEEVRFPVMLATVLCALGWFATLSPVNLEAKAKVAEWWHDFGSVLSAQATTDAGVTTTALAGSAAPELPSDGTGLANVLVPEQTPVAFAFYGAYFFSLQLLFQRYMRRDLSSRSYVGTSMRLVLPIIATWVLVSVVGQLHSTFTEVEDALHEPWMLGVAFMIGALPLSVLTMLANIFRRVPGLSYLVPGLHARRQLSELDGLTLWHQARLEEEDVDNIPGMATVDLAALMISTRIAPNRLVDWVDQAILLRLLPLDEERKKWTDLRTRLESRGIRMASGLRRLCNAEGFEQDSAWTWLADDQGRALAQALIVAAEDSPNLKLIESWHGRAAAAP